MLFTVIRNSKSWCGLEYVRCVLRETRFVEMGGEGDSIRERVLEIFLPLEVTENLFL
jgi:hypothetical protein